MHLPHNSASAYDDLPYGSNWRLILDPIALAAHPDRDSWVGFQRGSAPRSVCDLACGSGRQVLQGALLHPDIEFLGVDGSSAHIGEATALRNALGIKNARFECADLLEWSPAAARFDLITCSGTYPWVPDSVRERILEIVARTLADDGFAVLHVLSLPACLGLSEAQRQLLDAVGEVHPMSARLRAAKNFVPPLAPSDAPAAPEPPMVGIVRTLLRKFVERNDAGAAHEFLGSPVRADYFRDFEAQVARHGLHVVGDANREIEPAEQQRYPAAQRKATHGQKGGGRVHAAMPIRPAGGLSSVNLPRTAPPTHAGKPLHLFPEITL